jgi:UDP-glucose 4-epimerase
VPLASGTCGGNPLSIFLITGGAGFIGSHLADALLSQGHDVRVLDDLSTGRVGNLAPAAVLMRADTCDPAALDRALAGASGCFHLAAIASVQRGNEDWSGTHRVNQGGAVAVLDAARRAGGVPVVYASSAAVYGDLGGAIATESALCVPQTAYGADKRGCELHAAIAWPVHGVPSFGLRFFNVYGRRQDPASPYSGVISIFAARIAAGRPITIHGDGAQTRDFIHVSDVVAHMIAAMALLKRAPGAHIANVCTGAPNTIRNLAETLGDLSGKPPHITHGEARGGDIRASIGDPGFAIITLGVRASTTLSQGLADLLLSMRATPIR